MSAPIQPASELPPPLLPREWRLRLDPLLLLATLGLIACSLIAIKGATRDDFAEDPLHYVKRQAVYATVGLVLMYGDLAAGLLAPARVALPALRVADRLDHPRPGHRPGDTRCEVVDRAAVLQPAALGARQGPAGRGPGRVRRRAHARDGTPYDRSRDVARPGPDDHRDGGAGSRLGHRLRRRDARDAVRRGRSTAALRRPDRAVRGQRLDGARGGTQGRCGGAPPLPGRSPHRVPASQRGQERDRLPAGAGEDRHRLGREDRPWRRRCDADVKRLPARAPHGLHLRGDRRDVWVRRLCACAVVVRALDLARTCTS